MGAIPSISLPSIITCRSGCTCADKCYAHKLERLRPAVRNAYARNLKLLKDNPDVYFRKVEAAIMMTDHFRFHVSGDIPNADYLDRMVKIAERQVHCQILCFTKRYEIVNTYLNQHVLPSNLHLIFSVWRDMPHMNPYRLPEAHVRYRDGYTTAPEDAKPCGGNCTECAENKIGCWTLKTGESVVFREH